MSIGTYAELLAHVEDLLDRDDLDSRFQTLVQLAEARMNRLLDDPEMEVTATTTAENGEASLPDDFGEMVSLSTGDGRLNAVGPAEFSGFRQIGGTPRNYSISDGVLSFAPGTVGTITMTYRRRLPPLTATEPTNWLLSLAPDAYLHSVMAQACLWDHDEERASLHKAAADEVIGELRSDGSRRKWGAGPIAPRINRP